MKNLLFAALGLVSSLSLAAPAVSPFPGCDIVAQRAIQGSRGGSMTDPRQAHIAMRANIIQADIGNARKSQILTQSEAERLWLQVEQVRKAANGFVKQQGFLSAAERASYDRELDRIAKAYCR